MEHHESSTEKQQTYGALSQEQQAKVAAIIEACRWKDVEALRLLATSKGGLISDELRREACSCYQMKNGI